MPGFGPLAPMIRARCQRSTLVWLVSDCSTAHRYSNSSPRQGRAHVEGAQPACSWPCYRPGVSTVPTAKTWVSVDKSRDLAVASGSGIHRRGIISSGTTSKPGARRSERCCFNSDEAHASNDSPTPVLTNGPCAGSTSRADRETRLISRLSRGNGCSVMCLCLDGFPAVPY